MTNVNLEQLNSRYGILGHIAFESGSHGLPIATVNNQHASASVSLHGGHILSYQPNGHSEVLWISSQSKYQAGKAIRGGVPVCWPWFADHPTDSTKPAHGIVRTQMWQVVDTSSHADNQTTIKLRIQDNQISTAIWPYPFELTLSITVGPHLRIELSGKNTGDQPITCGGALHSYFSVADTGNIRILGLDGVTYIDKTDAFKRKTQHGPLLINQFTDSVFIDTAADCVIEDPHMCRRIHIAKTNSKTTVVWNPWADKAVEMSDFADDEYFKMVCVESANEGDDVARIPPGGEHKLGTYIGVEHI